MSILCIKQDGVWREARYGLPVTNSDGIMASWETIMIWSNEDRVAFGIVEAPEAPKAPRRKVEVSRVLSGTGDAPEWTMTFGKAPPAPELAEPLPPVLTDRQFARGLRDEGLITFEECVAFVGPGTIPAALLEIFNAIPDQEERENAIIDVSGAQSYHIDDKVIGYISFAKSWTPEYLLEKWLAWAKL